MQKLQSCVFLKNCKKKKNAHTHLAKTLHVFILYSFLSFLPSADKRYGKLVRGKNYSTVRRPRPLPGDLTVGCEFFLLKSETKSPVGISITSVLDCNQPCGLPANMPLSDSSCIWMMQLIIFRFCFCYSLCRAVSVNMLIMIAAVLSLWCTLSQATQAASYQQSQTEVTTVHFWMAHFFFLFAFLLSSRQEDGHHSLKWACSNN